MSGDRRQVYLNWSEEKIRLEERQSNTFSFFEREVWWVALGKNIGHEIDGKNTDFARPALVLRKFSPTICLVLPLTTQIKAENPFQFVIHFNNRSTALVLDQSRTISAKRLINLAGSLDTKQFELIKENFKKLL